MVRSTLQHSRCFPIPHRVSLFCMAPQRHGLSNNPGSKLPLINERRSKLHQQIVMSAQPCHTDLTPLVFTYTTGGATTTTRFAIRWSLGFAEPRLLARLRPNATGKRLNLRLVWDWFPPGFPFFLWSRIGLGLVSSWFPGFPLVSDWSGTGFLLVSDFPLARVGFHRSRIWSGFGLLLAQRISSGVWITPGSFHGAAELLQSHLPLHEKSLPRRFAKRTQLFINMR